MHLGKCKINDGTNGIKVKSFDGYELSLKPNKVYKMAMGQEFYLEFDTKQCLKYNLQRTCMKTLTLKANKNNFTLNFDSLSHQVAVIDLQFI